MFEPFQQFVGTAAGRYGIKKEVVAAEVCHKCDTVIKEVFKDIESVDVYIKAGHYKEGVIVIDVENPAWAQEVIMRKETIIERLKKGLKDANSREEIKNLRTRLKHR